MLQFTKIVKGSYFRGLDLQLGYLLSVLIFTMLIVAGGEVTEAGVAATVAGAEATAEEARGRCRRSLRTPPSWATCPPTSSRATWTPSSRT